MKLATDDQSPSFRTTDAVLRFLDGQYCHSVPIYWPGDPDRACDLGGAVRHASQRASSDCLPSVWKDALLESNECVDG